MGVGEVLRSFFVLAAVGSYGLPLYEAIQRRSKFYITVFSIILGLSATMHCHETGVCSNLSQSMQDRLSTLSGGMSLYLGALMLLIVFEIRNEMLARVIMAIWAGAATFRDPHDLKVNLPITLVLGIIILVADVTMFRRRFTSAWWRRLGLISLMALFGAGLFRMVHSAVNYWHGIWHIYIATTVYLLMLAQRTKRMLAAKQAGKRVPGGTGHSSGMNQPLTTPTKRRGGGSIGNGAAAGILEPEESVSRAGESSEA